MQETILLVDTQHRRAASFSRKLLNYGYDVCVVENTTDLFQKVKNQTIDIILIDEELVKEEKAIVKNNQLAKLKIPVVIMADNKSFGGMSEILKIEAFDFIKKPFQMEELRYLIERIYKKEKLLLDLINKEKELSILDEIGKMVISTLELKKVLNIIMEKTKQLVKSEAWSLLLVDEKSNELVFEVATGDRSEKVKRFKLNMGEGIAGWVAQSGEPLLVPDVSKDPRFFEHVDKTTEFKTKSILCVPLKSKGKILGVIEIINKYNGEPFNERDLNLVLKLADHASIAIENAKLYQQTMELSLTDDLTKLYNSRYFNQFLDVEIKRCKRYKSDVSLIFLDLDFFKRINDKNGHLMGSKVLIEVAQILNVGLRDVDVVARYGGDEFLIILPRTKIKVAGSIAERIRKAIENHKFLSEEGLFVRLTASFGISSFPQYASSKEDLINFSDKAMYKVKNMYRNGIHIADKNSDIFSQ